MLDCVRAGQRQQAPRTYRLALERLEQRILLDGPVDEMQPVGDLSGTDGMEDTQEELDSALDAGMLGESLSTTSFEVVETPRGIWNYFPRDTQAENGITLQARVVGSSTYIDLVNTRDYAWETPGAPYSLPSVLRDGSGGTISAHPAATDYVGHDRDPVIRVLPDAEADALRVFGTARTRNSHSIDFTIWKGADGWENPLWTGDPADSFDFLVPWSDGEKLFFATNAEENDANDWAFWEGIKISSAVWPVKVVAHAPIHDSDGAVDAVDVTFNKPVDLPTFTEQDLGLTGPGGSVPIGSIVEQGEATYRVGFPAQAVEGEYTVSIGPDIQDLKGHLMDQDGDGSTGEDPDDVYAGAFTIDWTPPEVKDAEITAESVTVEYHDSGGIDPATVTDTDNYTLVSSGGDHVFGNDNDQPVTIEEVTYQDDGSGDGTATLSFAEQLPDERYRLAIDGVGDLAGNALAGGVYLTDLSLEVRSPRVISVTPSGPFDIRAEALDSITVTFSEPVDFSPEGAGGLWLEDIVIEGPEGVVTPTGMAELGGNRYEVSFAGQTQRGAYGLEVGPTVTDLAGNLLDQDGDGTGGEAEEDVYAFGFDAYDADVVFAAPASIGAGDTSYAGQDILVRGSTLTVDGTHSFESIHLIEGGVLTHTKGLGDGLELVISTDAIIGASSAISADGRGHGRQSGPGAGIRDDHGGGGSYGGLGGAPTGEVYGSVREPTELGSGGGDEYRWLISLYGGVAGGGALRLTVDGLLTLDGRISADGASAGDRSGGAGSGGSVYLTVGELAGVGQILANGGDSDGNGGGGGGRVAVYYGAKAGFEGSIQAAGGSGWRRGGAGSVYMEPTSGGVGELILSNAGERGAETPLLEAVSNLEVRDGARAVVADPAVDISFGRLEVLDGGRFLLDRSLTVGSGRIAAGGLLTHSSGRTGFDLTVSGDLVVEEGGRVSADGRGHGRQSGPGAGIRDDHGGGGSYGGLGGAPTGEVYGSVREPTELGSGGGDEYRWLISLYGGVAGGGALRLTVDGLLTLDGRISADGASAGDRSGGAGSGGSVYLTVGELAGVGQILANGGDSDGNGGGGGGRVAVYYGAKAGFEGTIGATGGTGYEDGQDGTVFFYPINLLHVEGHSPHGPINEATGQLYIFFDKPVDPATFDIADMVLTDPDRNQVAITGAPEPVSGSADKTWRISIPPQSVEGEYELHVGPHIGAVGGHALDQDWDANEGESPDDVYAGTFTIDLTPPRITALRGLPAEGEATEGLVDSIGVSFSENLLPETARRGSFGLREVGADGEFGTADDAVYELWVSSANESHTEMDLFIEGGPLANGRYRFEATVALTDHSGNALDGDGDGESGDAYVRNFTVTLPPGYVLENGSNDARSAATFLPLGEEPAGSGYQLGRGLGSIQPSSDEDWWSFEALAGDVVSVSMNTPWSTFDPYVYLYDADGERLSSNADDGPGHDAFISHYPIANSGRYFVCVESSDDAVGEYRLRLDLARGIELESDSAYDNGDIEGSDSLAMQSVGRRRNATVAGTIMAASETADEDYYDLGYVGAGESVIVSLRLPGSSTLRPAVQLRNAQGKLLEVTQSPIGTAARLDVTEPGNYYGVVVGLTGEGLHGQYVMDAAVWPTADLDFPDLIVDEIVAPGQASSGETVQLSWNVRNYGTGGTYSNSWFDRIVLSENDRYGDADDVELARVLFEGSLELDEEYTGEVDVQLPLGISGDHTVFVETDDGNRLFEYTFETNNVSRAPAPIASRLTPAADLAAETVIAPQEILTTDPVTVMWEVTNDGVGTTGDGTPGGVVSEWADRIVFSRDEVYGNADDRVVAEVARTESLAAGESYAGSWTGALPLSLAGDYYVFVASDAEDDIYEHTDEQPNVARAAGTTTVRQWIVQPVTISEDTVWDGLVKVLGDVTVASETTLTVDPGTIVKFVSGGLDVRGTLNVEGSAEAPVVFSTWTDDGAGGDTNADGAATSPIAGDWEGIGVYGPGEAVIENGEIRYAREAVYGRDSAVVTLDGAYLHHNRYGIYSWIHNVDIQVVNTVIARNETGVYSHGLNRQSFLNATIVDNGTGLDYDGSNGITLSMQNTVVAHNDTGLDNRDRGTAEATIQYSLFHNSTNISWSGGGGTEAPDLASHGNVVAAPMLVDAVGGDYSLAAGSPGIDSARGIGAPGIDMLGRPRFDDPGLANLGAGHPAYVDIGAFERQEATVPAVDLSVTDVSVTPLEAEAGDTVTVSWTGENTGQRTLTEDWTDEVYLSTDPYLSVADDVLLGQEDHSDDLAVGRQYRAEWAGPVPSGVSGPLYVIARANAGASFREARLFDNSLSSPRSVAVAVPALTTDLVQTGHVEDGGWSYYRFAGQPGQTVKFSVDSDVAAGSVQLYLRQGAVPTASNYDEVADEFGQPDEELRLIQPGDATYYVGVYGQSLTDTGTDFDLSAELPPLQIREITPGEVGNGGPVTVEIVGDNFARTTEATLVAEDGTTVEGDEWFEDASSLFATFDLAAAPATPGLYDVVLTNPGPEVVSVEDALDVVSGGLPAFDVDLIVPGMARPGRKIDLRVEYSNTGNVDLPSPMLTLESSEGAAWLLPDDHPENDWIDSESISFLALSGDGPASILRPGQSRTLTLRAETPLTPGDMPVELYAFGMPGQQGLSDEIDWGQMEDDLAPPDARADSWDPLFGRLEAQIGSTWGDYVDMLRSNADGLAEVGQRVHATQELFGFEFVQASTLGSPTYLESAQDGFVPAPALPLSFERYYRPGPSYRARLGTLGRGWTHSYDITLRERSDGSVVINGSSGMDRMFEPDGNGGYAGGTGDHATLMPITEGGVTEYRLTEMSGPVTRFRSDGRFRYLEDTNGNRISASYNASGQLLALTHSSGDRFELEYGDEGRVASVTDHVDRTTRFGYDSTGEHLTSVTTPGGLQTEYEYITAEDTLGRHLLTDIAPPGGPSTHFDYDSLGRLAGQQVGSGLEPVTYSYSDAGRTTTTDALGNSSLTWMDSRGRNVMTQNPLGYRSQRSYDSKSNLIEVTGPTGLSTHFTYDAFGNVISTRNAAGFVTSFEYGGPHHEMTLVRDANGNVTTYSHDEAGNRTAITYADETLETYSYDGVGKLISFTNRRAQAITYTYNARGQMRTKDYDTTPGVLDFDYAYDAVGNMTEATNEVGTITMEFFGPTHANADQLKKITYPAGQWLSYTYDHAGRRTSMLDQLGHRQDYHYDGAGHLQSINDETDGHIVQYAYDVAGRMQRKTLGNDVYITFAYDPAGQLLDLHNRKPDGTTLSRFQYTYDPRGLRTEMVTAYGPDDPREDYEGTWSYEYDPLGQLVAWADPTGHGVRYVYDPMGNRLEVVEDGLITEYAVNEMNQYATVGGEPYQYDADGNLVDANDGEGTYRFNPENRLIGASTAEGHFSYGYDALGQRTLVNRAGDRVLQVIDPSGLGTVVGEYDPTSGSLRTRHTYGHGLLETSSPAGESSYYTFGTVGSTSELLTSEASVRASYGYSPFGIVFAGSSHEATAFQFVGQWGVTNEGNGLHSMRARFFQAGLGRFISEDPLEVLVADVHRYAYASNSPLTYVDPSGLIEINGVDFDHQDGLALVGILSNFVSGPVGATAGIGSSVAGIDTAQSLLNTAAGTFATVGAIVGGTATAPFWLTVGGAFALGGAASTLGKASVAFDPPTIMWPRPSQIPFPFPFPDAMPFPLPIPLPIPIGNWPIPIPFPIDPEDKFGPAGYDAGTVPEGQLERWVQPGNIFDYRIEFWNREDALVPAQDAVFVDELNPNLVDLSTLEFERVGFLDWEHETSGQVIDVRIDCRPEMNIAVEIRAGLGMEVPGFAHNDDITDSTLVWWFHTIDPVTGEYPEDPMAGFLPPFDPETGTDIGWMDFTVRPKQGLPNGTQIANVAYGEFDFMGDLYSHPAPKDENENPDPWINTIDAAAPTSYVTPLPDITSTSEFLVEWEGEDENGSGVVSYDVFASTDGGAYELWLDDTPDTSATFSGEIGHAYSFYSTARDGVGFEEEAPAEADATTLVNEPPTDISLDSSAVEENQPAGTVVGTFSSTDPDSGESFTYRLVGGDGDAGNSYFAIDGSILWTAEAFDYESQSSYGIRVETEDSVGNTYQEAFTISVTDVNEAPSVDLVSPADGEEVGSGESYLVNWTDGDPDDDAALDLWWDLDRNADNNTAQNQSNAWGWIATGISENDASDSHEWTVDAPAGGDYYLGAFITDGRETTGDYTENTLHVSGGGPGVQDAVVNGGDAQRSIVDSLTLTFDQQVNVAVGALVMDGPEEVDARLVSASTGTSFTWEFDVDGDGVFGDSLSDGRWNARLDRVRVTDGQGNALQDTDSNPGDGLLDAVSVHRLYGDVDGDGDVDGSDYYQFRNAYFQYVQTGVLNEAFDYDADGDIDYEDYTSFCRGYGQRI